MLLGFKPLATRQGCCELTPTPLPVILSFTAVFFSHSGSVPNIIGSQPPCTHRHCVHHSAHTTVRQAESPRAACSQAAKPSEFLILLLQVLQFQVLALGVSTVPSALVGERQPAPPSPDLRPEEYKSMPAGAKCMSLGRCRSDCAVQVLLSLRKHRLASPSLPPSARSQPTQGIT